MLLRKLLLVGLIIILSAGMVRAASDPGIPDTVKIEGGPLKIGQSIPLYLTIVNDENLGGYCLGHIFTSLDGGFAICDSVVYINRMADPNVLLFRLQEYWHNQESGTPPDSFALEAVKYSGYPLGPGNDPIIMLYFTAQSPGTMRIDSSFFAPAFEYILSTNEGFSIYPQFSSDDIEIIEGSIPPVVEIPDEPGPVSGGDMISFEVTAGSPEGFPITMNIVSLTGYDDNTMTPINLPTLSSDNPAEFQWQTTSNDIGIWEAIIQVCDSSNTCSSVSVVLQVAESEDFIFGFSIKETPNTVYSTGICRGNFDQDANLEIFSTGSGQLWTTNAQLYDFNENDSLDIVYDDFEMDNAKFGPALGFFNKDKKLDAIMMRWVGFGNYASCLMLGNGGNSFQEAGLSNDGSCTRSTCLGELTGDNHLDFASTWYDGVRIFAGDKDTGFVYDQMINTSDSTLSVNCADFDCDRRDDLAIGTTHELMIYLANAAGGFDYAYAYPQTYGAMEIEVTNQGSDFNDDDIYDLCISTPSVGGAYSQMMLYLGNGDGSFNQTSLRTVKGQIFGNCVGDMNNDGKLDIVYVNGAKRYVAILFGDGSGNFINEIRFDIPHEHPRYVDCTDIDLDGDIDLIVAANGFSAGNNSVFLLLNNLDPGGFHEKTFELSAANNVDIELESSSGRVFNKIKNTMPSGDYYRRNNDDNGILDIYSSLAVLESGQYVLRTRPRADLPSGLPFSLEFMLDSTRFRLAENIPMSANGYDFGINPILPSTIIPIPGSFIYNATPLFVWPGSGEFDFQLAEDIDFTSLVVNETVSENNYQLLNPLEDSGNSIYYWRVKQHDEPDFECIYAVNVLAGIMTNCGDANNEGSVNISDAVYIINFIFNGGPAPDPFSNADTNCDGTVNVSDVVYIINYVFIGGNPPCDLDANGEPDC